MSFITYSTVGQTLMKLTSNKQEIQEALAKLKTVVPTSDRNMQEGFKKANEQIQRVFLRDSNAASLIISLTTGPLLPKTVRETKNEVNIAQSMGAKVYSMGVNKYKKGQLVENSCLDVMKEDSFVACVGEIYNLGFFVNGLERAKMDNYVCRYNLDTTKVYSKKSTNITSEKLICPGHVFEKAGQVVIVEYSLDNSVSFENITLKVTSKDCLVTSSYLVTISYHLAPVSTIYLPCPFCHLIGHCLSHPLTDHLLSQSAYMCASPTASPTVHTHYGQSVLGWLHLGSAHVPVAVLLHPVLQEDHQSTTISVTDKDKLWFCLDVVSKPNVHYAFDNETFGSLWGYSAPHTKRSTYLGRKLGERRG
ncbi:anthrax toxin receptor-like [Pteropus medius]|uniref:anthrax toxin receptor-like n=1 Tax=Pteropus vampyrus TaxID=132908 RepID=UPI00196B5440|nr:anthrax toxin receptor-like [Pteropus giganteus]